MNFESIISGQQKSIGQLTHANTMLKNKTINNEKAISATRRTLNRLMARQSENNSLREHVAMLSEKVDILSEQVMTLSELNHNLTCQAQEVVTQLAPTEARDNVTNIKRIL